MTYKIFSITSNLTIDEFLIQFASITHYDLVDLPHVEEDALRGEDGFRLGDLTLPLASAVLCGLRERFALAFSLDAG